MKKNFKYYICFLTIMVLAFILNLFCIFKLLSFKYWRLSLIVILVLLGAVWFFVTRIRKTDKKFEMIYTRSQKIIMNIVIFIWGITFFSAIF